MMAYPWRQQQHINVLEFIAFLVCFRRMVLDPEAHSHRYFHIFDSRVAACIATKGRSSAQVLNRSARRLCAFSIASDMYLLALWTISGWNSSDAASRLHTSRNNGKAD